MKLAEIEYEHPSNQFTVDTIRSRFISAINDECWVVLDQLKKDCLIKFLKTGIHKIPKRIEKSKQEWNSNLMLQFWENYKERWIVCQFDIIQNISSEEQEETIAVSLITTQHFLHSVCEKWAKKLSNHYYSKYPEHRKLYVMDIVKYYPPCPWMYDFWKSIVYWAEQFNLVESDEQDKWLFESAVYTIDYWSKNPKNINDIGLLESSPYHKQNLKTLEPPFGLPEWEAQYKERKIYLEEAKNFITEELNKIEFFKENQKRLGLTVRQIFNEAEIYCDKVEKHFRSNGWKKVTVKKEFEKHLEWAIRFQVKEESYSSIAREYGVYASSVKKEVEEILGIIGLKRRGLKRGRKKGQTTSETSKILKSLGK